MYVVGVSTGRIDDVSETLWDSNVSTAEGFTEPAECWRGFPSWLETRGLTGARTLTDGREAAITGGIAGKLEGMGGRSAPSACARALPKR